MNLRLTLTSAVAVILASVSLYPLIQTATWFWAGVGAVIAAAIAGTITRLPTLQAAAGTSVLALIAVTPLLANPSVALKCLGVIIVAITAASRPRFRVLQVLACPIAYLAGLLIYLNAAFAPRLSMARILPTQTSLSYLSFLVGQGMHERYLEPPVPGYQGIVLVAAAGIGLMGAATDLIAVRLRSPAIAGLPLLALYCVRITTSVKQGGVGATVVFCLGMIGYLALLAADGRERLRIWGRLVTVWHTSATEPAEAEAPDTRALAASGRRIGLAAACLALIVPLLVPGINVHDLLRAESGGGTGPNGPPISMPDPLVQMRDQLLSSTPRTVLTYTTTVPHPQYQYLQVYVLNYDTSTEAWNLVLPQPQATASLGNPALPDPGVTASTSLTRPTTKITIAQGAVGYEGKLGVLPLPYAPTRVQVQEGGWQEDDATQMVYSTQPQMSGLPYTVTSTEVNPTPKEEDLAPSYPASIKNNYLYFPAGPGGQLAKLAARITKNARTPYQKAVKLQSYFQSAGFSYDLNVSLPNGIAGLVQFLDSVRAGYCQQFAFAMAALARLVGIPARIAVGYTAGTNMGKGVWAVTTADAHAWPELYFRGMGWLRFEPTPGGAAGQGTATVPQYGSGAPPGYGKMPVTTSPGLGPGRVGKEGIPDPAHLRQPGNGGGGTVPSVGRGRSIIPWILLIVAIILVLGLIAPAAARRLIRHRRLRTADDAELAHAAWRELRDELADYGLACRVSESPRAVASRVATTLRLDPSTAEALGRIASAEERARYATAPLPSTTLAADSAAIRRALAREADWTGRWRARLVPTSMLTPIRAALQHVLDVFGWMDAAGLKFRGRAFGGPQHQE
jgi:transglutaminase-like putative cysteine protease